MRTEKVLKELVDDALRITGGSMPLTLIAEDEAESAALWGLIKGRRGGKSITIRLARHPDEFRPVMDLVRRKSERQPQPAPALAELDYDGY